MVTFFNSSCQTDLEINNNFFFLLTVRQIVLSVEKRQAVSNKSELSRGKGLWLSSGDANFSCTKGDNNLFYVRPTGGSTQWTATVCECLSYYLTGAEVKMIIQVCIQKQWSL